MVAVLWRRRDVRGHEHATLERNADEWILSGVALFAHEQQPCRLSYIVRCDGAWSTKSARVAGSVGTRAIDVTIVAESRRWLNGVECANVEGCLDVDLNFSPSTNLLPIRRLSLDVGREALVRAAWLRFPSFALEPLEQTYRRLAGDRYRYESAGGSFVAEIDVNPDGLPLEYAGVWTAECVTRT